MNKKDYREKLNYRSILLSVIVLLTGFLLPAASLAEETGVQKIRVGFFAFEGYHDMNEQNGRSGYGYDFLTLVKRYSNLTFEYVGYDHSWSDMLQMLQNGEIDMVTSAHKTPEREEIFDFSLPIGTNSFQINVRQNETRFIPDDYATFDGMVIGLLEGSSDNSRLISFAGTHHFQLHEKYYATVDALNLALSSGEVDAIGTSSLRISTGEKTLYRFDTEYIYAIVRKGNTALLNCINDAIEQMDLAEGDWQSKLTVKYYGNDRGSILSFTEAEKAFIDQHRTQDTAIRVITDNNWAPFSQKVDDHYEGIIPDYFDMIMQFSGLKYTFVDPGEDVYNAETAGIKEGKGDIYLCYTSGIYILEENGYQPTAPLMSLGTAYLKRKNCTTIERIALCETTPYLNAQLTLREGQTVTLYEDSAAAIKAVKDGREDAAYLYSYDALHLKNMDYTGLLVHEPIPDVSVDLYAVIPEQNDHRLISIISKCAKQLTGSDLGSVVSKNLSVNAQALNLFDYAVMHPDTTAIILTAFMFSIITLFYMIQKNRSEKKIGREKQQINEKLHLVNQELQQKQQEIDSQFAILKSLSAVYDYISLLDFYTCSATRFDEKTPEITQFDLSGDSHTELSKKTAEYIEKDELEHFLAFTDLSTLEERLRGNRVISQDFKCRNNIWIRILYIRIGDDLNAGLGYVASALRNITQDRGELENVYTSVAGLLYSLHLIDMENNTVKALIASDMLKKMTGEETHPQKLINILLGGTCSDAHLSSIKQFIDLSTVDERLKHEKYLSSEFIGKFHGWTRISFVPIETKDGHITKLAVTTQIIDSEKRQMITLQYKSSMDEMTELLNRRSYEEELDLLDSAPVNDPYAIIAIDVNGLKTANDTLGHKAGDEMLIGAADCMKNVFGKHGKVFRTGGDEFVVILRCNAAALKDILAEYEKANAAWADELGQRLSVSYGSISSEENPGLSAHELTVIADKRMYAAKAAYYTRNGFDRRGRKL